VSASLLSPPFSAFPFIDFAVLTAVGIGFHAFFTGATKAGGQRKLFGKDFVEKLKTTEEGKKLIADHKAAIGAATDEEAEKSLVNGYPDMGNGRIASHLDYASWFKFNNGQRAHYNYLEQVPSALSFLLIGGLMFPTVATGAGVGIIVGRELYAQGYVNQGPKGRSIGAGINMVALTTLFGTAVLSGLKIAKLLK
jgi:hypothetical protein